ncbi:MAG TPA: hypothetical protein VEF06_06890 [Bryobacteraceae bacterium]|nr:hypothetical protein [Bryobacteraceae bacterium]
MATKGLLLAALLALPAFAQTYSSGQQVWPAFEGWEKNDDGTFNLVFGYMNDNWQEELNVPVGPDNKFEPGPADQGQPTHFLPRRNRFIFRVKVPKDFGTKELVWTLNTQGRTAKAYGSLRQDLLLENVDLMSETGSLGAGASSPEIRANKPPVVVLNSPKTLTAKVDQPVELIATVTDDGIPKPLKITPAMVEQMSKRPPQRPTVNKINGLHLSWFVYRGDGHVVFEPSQIKVWEDTRAGANSPWAPIWLPPPVPADGRYMVKVTFGEPGTYTLCARADDGGLTTDELVTVTVTR